jgi:hypothetical protein
VRVNGRAGPWWGCPFGLGAPEPARRAGARAGEPGEAWGVASVRAGALRLQWSVCSDNPCKRSFTPYESRLRGRVGLTGWLGCPSVGALGTAPALQGQPGLMWRASRGCREGSDTAGAHGARLTLEVSVTSRVGVTRGRCDADGRDSGTGVGFGVGVALALVRRAARGAQGTSAWPIPSPSSRQPNKRAGRDGSSARVSRLRRPGRSARLSGGTTVAGEARPPSQSPEVPPPEAQTPAL